MLYFYQQVLSLEIVKDNFNALNKRSEKGPIFAAVFILILNSLVYRKCLCILVQGAKLWALVGSALFEIVPLIIVLYV